MYSVVNISWWLLPQGSGTNYVVVALFIKSGAWVAKLALSLCKELGFAFIGFMG